MDNNANNTKQKKWYIVNTYSGREEKVCKNLQNLKKTDPKLSQQIGQILVVEVEEPMKDRETGAVKKDKNGNVRMKKRNLYPGYIFVEMIMEVDSWYKVRNAPDVTGITGSSGGGQKPNPVSDEEMEPVLKRMNIVKDDMYLRYMEGDEVRIIKGPLSGSEGIVKSIDKESNNLVVEVVFFGNAQEHTVPFSDVEKK